MDNILQIYLSLLGNSVIVAVGGYIVIKIIDGKVAHSFDRQLEKFKVQLSQDEKLEELIGNIKQHQRPVLEEAVRLIVRINEIFEGRFIDDYNSQWNPKQLSKTNLEGSKRDTAVYRFLRLLGEIEIYETKVSGLPTHKVETDSFFRWYVDIKIIPLLASGGFPGHSFLWRDSIFELKELMVTYSNIWNQPKTLSWFEYVDTITKTDDKGNFMNEYSERVAAFFRGKSTRLALLGIYLIDLIQDNTERNTWERQRNYLLNWLKQNCNPQIEKFSIYGMTEDGSYDWIAMNPDKGIVPRNNRSLFFNNEINYKL